MLSTPLDISCYNNNNNYKKLNDVTNRLLDKVKVFILVVKVLLQVGHEVGLRDYNDKVQPKVPRNKDILI